jgi:alpha-tubulin suppressor-like RCC1 family protein
MSFSKLFHRSAVPLVLKLSSLLLLLAACNTAPPIPPPDPSASTTITSFGATPNPTPSNVLAQFSWSVTGTNLTCTLDVDGDAKIDYTVPNCTSQSRVGHTYGVQGSYTAKLTVSGADGLTKNQTTPITVGAANIPPVIPVLNAASGSSTDPLSVTFNWTTADGNSDITRCEFDADSDGKLDYNGLCSGLASSSQVAPANTVSHRFTYKYPKPGRYSATLMAFDPYSSATATLQVRAPYNRAPLINTLRANATSDNTGTVSFDVSDLDEDTLSCTLQVESIGTFHYKNCSRITRTYQFVAPGSYEITLTVSDGKATTTQKSTLVFDSSKPPPPPVPVGVKQIVAGATHTCVLTSAPTSADQPPEGTALCWGFGIFGQLGTSDFADDYDDPKDGTPNGAASAVTVEVPAGTTFTSLATGYDHTCGLTAAGKAYCWGENGDGQLGDGTTTNRFEAVAVQGGLTFTQISAGWTHTCGIADQVYCWGSDTLGALGNDPTIANSTTPVAIDADFVIGQIFKEVYAGSASTCALSTTGSRYCWGSNYFGKLGLGVGDANFAVPTLDTTSPYYKHMAFFRDGGCALTLAIVCWGNQDYGGKLGDDGVSSGVAYTPVQVAYSETDLPAKMATSSSPNEHSCFLTAAGKAWCWGKGQGGRVGDGNGNFNNKKPVAVAGDTGVLIDLAVGSLHTCAVSSDFKAYCWGDNSVGQLGLGEAELFAAQVVPTLVPVAYQAP